MYDRIFVPTDGSEPTETVVEHALAVAEGRDATIYTLSVADRRLFLSADRDEQDDVLDDLRAEAEQAVAAVESQVEAAGVPVVGEVRVGVPHTEIIRYADEMDVDLVVIGTHGRTGPEKLVNMGSVSERVVKNANQPVLVVRLDAE